MADTDTGLFFSPTDDILTRLVAFASATTAKLLIFIYAFDYDPLIDAVLQLHQGGKTVRGILDESQYKGHYEQPRIARLQTAGIPLLIGHSPDDEIIHSKYLVRDDAWVFSGSFNFSWSAQRECNFVDIINDPTRAAQFTQNFEAQWAYLQAQAAKEVKTHGI